MEFTFKSLGISAGGPFMGRWPSSNVLSLGAHQILLDCGEGTQIVFQKYKIGWRNLDVILISHLHGDHLFGLFGLLTSWSLQGRKKALKIISPKGLQQMVEAVIEQGAAFLSYDIIWQVVDPSVAPELLFENKHYTIQSLPLNHRIPCSGYLIKEKLRPRTIRKEAIATFDIPYQLIKGIKNGADFTSKTGELIPNASLTQAPPPPRSLAYCVDTTYIPDQLVELIRHVDLLVHEATFMHDLVENASKNGHSTALQAAQIAQQAQVGKLILTHFSPRYLDLQPLLAEAKRVFSASELAKEGKDFEVPFAKRKTE